MTLRLPEPPLEFYPSQRRGWYISASLTLFRLLLAPTFVAFGILGVPGWVLAAALLLGFFSDVLDGVVARRANAVTADLRWLDSTIDTFFYLAVAYAACITHRAAIQQHTAGIGVILLGECASYGISLLKFGRSACHHAWTARLWGVLLFLSMVTLFVLGTSALLPIAIGAGAVAYLESIAITLVLPAWQTDVGSLWLAWRIRQAQ
jgi:CDP-diacylglycerol--glycerol-3-phosphate 3-phosphatidyltransferase